MVRSGTLLLLAAAAVWTGCSAPRDDSLERAVLRLGQPDRFTADEAAARLRDSLARRRAAAPGPVSAAQWRTLLRVAPDCSAAEKASAERLARRVFAARESLLAAGGLAEAGIAERTVLRFTLALEALPGAGCFVSAELADDGETLWREVLPVAE